MAKRKNVWTIVIALALIILGIAVLALKKDYTIEDNLRSNSEYYEFLCK